MKKYLCIHSHFYQPPRENPWTGEIEIQNMAAPYSDWNERINAECYASNGVSRILDGNNKITGIMNNYLYLSFNFGPTLLSWIEAHDKNTYEKILYADRESLNLYSNHGNAIAQCYNHIIMPLAEYKDKLTQVLWGIEDFCHRFNRYPEGMWLPETAVDKETLTILAEQNIKFVILSPYQANKIRELKQTDAPWINAKGANIDPSRAYLCNLDKGKSIAIFFYDPHISKSVAFDNLLSDGALFSERLRLGYSNERRHPQLLNIATDGETYGHHFKFGEMPLSFAIQDLKKNYNVKITNYGEYLSKYPPNYEVDVFENSSWSCFHGIERWRDNCGCKISHHLDWNQKWRTPLRQGLNKLKKKIDNIYENAISQYLRSPWEARDLYIKVILDRSLENINLYFNENSKRDLSEEERSECFRLLEMQRQAMFMFTSCGWFFDDISGIETVQILEHASKAMQIALQFGHDLEKDFLKDIFKAKSNVEKYNNGKEIYKNLVKSFEVDFKKVIANYAIKSLVSYYKDSNTNTNKKTIAYYEIEDEEKFFEKNEYIYISFGRIKVRNLLTLEYEEAVYAAFHIPNYELQCKVGPPLSISDYRKIKRDLKNSIKDYSLTNLIRKFDYHLQGNFYSLQDIFGKEKHKILSSLMDSSELHNEYKRYYEKHKKLMELYLKIDVPVNEEFKEITSILLSKKLKLSIKKLGENITKRIEENHNIDELQNNSLAYIEAIINESKKWDIKLNTKETVAEFKKILLKEFKKVAENTRPTKTLENIKFLLCIKTKIKLDINLWEFQNIYFRESLKCPLSAKSNKEHYNKLSRELANLLGFRDGFVSVIP